MLFGFTPPGGCRATQRSTEEIKKEQKLLEREKKTRNCQEDI
jgi:hypothetical protein